MVVDEWSSRIEAVEYKYLSNEIGEQVQGKALSIF